MTGNPKTLGEILFKSRPTEFEIQAEIYHLLREAKIEVRGEVTAKHLWNGKIRRCKFDLIVFHNKKPVIVIEVKQWGHSTANKGILIDHNSRQAEKYRTFGLPVIHCGHIENAPIVVSEVMKILVSSCIALNLGKQFLKKGI